MRERNESVGREGLRQVLAKGYIELIAQLLVEMKYFTWKRLNGVGFEL